MTAADCTSAAVVSPPVVLDEGESHSASATRTVPRSGTIVAVPVTLRSVVFEGIAGQGKVKSDASVPLPVPTALVVGKGRQAQFSTQCTELY